MKRYLGLLLLMALAGGCTDSEPGSDAWGNFEADETLVSSEVPGRLVSFTVRSGDRLEAGMAVGLIDTTRLHLQRSQLLAARAAVRSRLGSINAEVEVLREQVRVAAIERERVSKLVAEEAIPVKQLDDVVGQLAVLERRIDAARTQDASIHAEAATIDAQIDQVEDLIQRSTVINPVNGTVVADYAQPTEMTAAGRPLYRIARLDTLDLRAYVSGAQLPSIRIGEPVAVRYDDGSGGIRSVDGIVSWIASEAEFTPKLIQTREERVNLVYAFKVRVPNPDGSLKIGMPGEVRFGS